MRGSVSSPVSPGMYIPPWVRECWPALEHPGWYKSGPIGIPWKGWPPLQTTGSSNKRQPGPRFPRLESYIALSFPSQSALQEHMAMAVARYVIAWTTPPVTTSRGPVTAAQDGKGHDVIKVRILGSNNYCLGLYDHHLPPNINYFHLCYLIYSSSLCKVQLVIYLVVRCMSYCCCPAATQSIRSDNIWHMYISTKPSPQWR